MPFLGLKHLFLLLWFICKYFPNSLATHEWWSTCFNSQFSMFLPPVQIGNDWSLQCLDSACKPEDMHRPAGLWPCHGQGGNQVRHCLDTTLREGRFFRPTLEGHNCQNILDLEKKTHLKIKADFSKEICTKILKD